WQGPARSAPRAPARPAANRRRWLPSRRGAAVRPEQSARRSRPRTVVAKVSTSRFKRRATTVRAHATTVSCAHPGLRTGDRVSAYLPASFFPASAWSLAVGSLRTVLGAQQRPRRQYEVLTT